MTAPDQPTLFHTPHIQPIDFDSFGACCFECGVDTIKIGEFYGVRNDVWMVACPWTNAELVAPGFDFLCIGCLEARLGRTLTPEDFVDTPLNRMEPRSDRLRSRLGH